LPYADGRSLNNAREGWQPVCGSTYGRLFRTVSLSEHVKLQFRAEALNALNRPNFANPNGDISSANFGFVTSTTGTGQRTFRFAARLSF